MQDSKTFLENHLPLIRKVFNSYCIQKKVHLAASVKKPLFKKLLQQIYADWSKEIAELEMQVPSIAVLIEMVRWHCQELFKDNHTIDLTLLQTQPSELVVKYQAMIAYIVHKKLGKESDWSVDRREELIAQIRENLLQKISSGKLVDQFEGQSAFHNYLYRIIYNNMIDELRKLKKNRTVSSIESLTPKQQSQFAVNANEMNYIGLVEQHLRWLQVLIKGFPLQKQQRFEFSLMVVYRICLNVEDVRKLYADCRDDLLVEILSCFSQDYQHLSKTQIYQLLSEFIELLEQGHKHIRPDALRVWFQSRLASIKQTLFRNLPPVEASPLDSYFELLVYKLYKKI